MCGITRRPARVPVRLSLRGNITMALPYAMIFCPFRALMRRIDKGRGTIETQCITSLQNQKSFCKSNQNNGTFF
ncbi:MAG: hypothetical protein LBQ66_13785 [Planctomycetaceae bacterium]|nr:hypothetical protein [Planctomycetaceae bacterium]